MADLSRKHPKNAPGPWFVDLTCIACDTCTDISPEIFWRGGVEEGVGAGEGADRRAYVRAYRPEDADLFRAALESCPVEAVGDEGDPASLRPGPG